MIFREAVVSDIEQMQIVRNAVKENVLSNPALVSDAEIRRSRDDCRRFACLHDSLFGNRRR